MPSGIVTSTTSTPEERGVSLLNDFSLPSWGPWAISTKRGGSSTVLPRRRDNSSFSSRSTSSARCNTELSLTEMLASTMTEPGERRIWMRDLLTPNVSAKEFVKSASSKDDSSPSSLKCMSRTGISAACAPNRFMMLGGGSLMACLSFRTSLRKVAISLVIFSFTSTRSICCLLAACSDCARSLACSSFK